MWGRSTIVFTDESTACFVLLQKLKFYTFESTLVGVRKRNKNKVNSLHIEPECIHGSLFLRNKMFRETYLERCFRRLADYSFQKTNHRPSHNIWLVFLLQIILQLSTSWALVAFNLIRASSTLQFLLFELCFGLCSHLQSDKDMDKSYSHPAPFGHWTNKNTSKKKRRNQR